MRHILSAAFVVTVFVTTGCSLLAAPANRSFGLVNVDRRTIYEGCPKPQEQWQYPTTGQPAVTAGVPVMPPAQNADPGLVRRIAEEVGEQIVPNALSAVMTHRERAAQVATELDPNAPKYAIHAITAAEGFSNAETGIGGGIIGGVLGALGMAMRARWRKQDEAELDAKLAKNATESFSGPAVTAKK
jgi:hypothetical protein